MKVKVQGKVPVELELDKEELGRAVENIAWQMCGSIDDAGMDWYTDKDCKTTYICHADWIVSHNPLVASLIDAANILKYGKPLKIEEEENEQDNG